MFELIRDYYAIWRAAAIAGVLLFLIAGCAGPSAIRVPDEVLVPVSTCPVAVIPERPAAVRPTSNQPDEVMRAFALSVKQCQVHIGDLETLLKPYTKQEK